ncbi:thiol-disulfide oxidoreductase DCC family protein [Flavobacterium sp. RSB2_4_14]|uniref:thiol-disulfide oxidoreductase DCC family protein n=1 Tax=Flavobacterium sp. RSB2_4_14 TaxID=3447665 RepID=UPI003F2DDBC7
MSTLPKDKKIILFDGICNLCDSSVQLIIKHDKKDVFRFVSIQSQLGQEILNYIGVDSKKVDSIILYEPEIAYNLKSEAAFKIAKELSGIYRILGLCSIFPKVITNTIYDYIAKNRYKWYGKKESCLIPTEELRTKFL